MKIIKEFALRTIAGESLLIPTGKTSQELNGMITLSPTAAFIWENIEKVNSLDEMVAKITDEFEIDPDTARHDAFAFVAELIKHEFVIPTKEDMSW